MTTSRKLHITPAVARIDKPPKPTKATKLTQRRQVDAWRKQAERNRR